MSVKQVRPGPDIFIDGFADALGGSEVTAAAVEVQAEPVQGATVSGCRPGASEQVLLILRPAVLPCKISDEALVIPLHLPRLSWPH